MYRNPTQAELREMQEKFPWEKEKKPRGRPKGSTKKVVVVEDNDGVGYRIPANLLSQLGKRGRGRPKGSKNKKRGPGRPKGSKNKPKSTGRRGRPPGIHTRSSLGVSSRRDELTRFGTTRVFRNMTHFPKSPRGRPEKKSFWILDLYDSSEKHLGTRISKTPTSKKAAEMEAIDFIGHHHGGKVVRSLTIAGPYSTKPTASTERI